MRKKPLFLTGKKPINIYTQLSTQANNRVNINIIRVLHTSNPLSAHFARHFRI